jgi:hypothetical protein
VNYIFVEVKYGVDDTIDLGIIPRLADQSSTQALGEDAINLLFEKHRLNRIA